MIYGIGTDIVYIPRILRISQKYGEKFLNKVYTKKEIEISKKYNSQEVRAKYFAKRFAAKEAFVKALGTGFSQGIIMKDIEIYSNIRENHILLSQGFHLERLQDTPFSK